MQLRTSSRVATRYDYNVHQHYVGLHTNEMYVSASGPILRWSEDGQPIFRPRQSVSKITGPSDTPAGRIRTSTFHPARTHTHTQMRFPFFSHSQIWRCQLVQTGSSGILSIIYCSPNELVAHTILRSYLENGGEGALVKPWAWILWMGGGSVAQILLFHLYMFISVRASNVEAVLDMD